MITITFGALALSLAATASLSACLGLMIGCLLRAARSANSVTKAMGCVCGRQGALWGWIWIPALQGIMGRTSR